MFGKLKKYIIHLIGILLFGGGIFWMAGGSELSFSYPALFGCIDNPDESGGGRQTAGDYRAEQFGDWQTEGTRQNVLAKRIFDYWIERGVTAAGAAGPVGNAAIETGLSFHPLAVEAAYFNNRSYWSDDYGMFLYPHAKDLSGATGTMGYGVYQTSPGKKLSLPEYEGVGGYTYLPFGEPEGRLTDEMLTDMDKLVMASDNEGDFVWLADNGAGLSLSSKGYGLQNWVLENVSTGGIKAYDDFANTSSPKDSTYVFYIGVENWMSSRAQYYSNPYSAGHKREEAAEKAYKLFGAGGPTQADDALLRAEGTAEGSGRVEMSPDVDGADLCEPREGEGEADFAGDIVGVARKYLGWFHYSQGRPFDPAPRYLTPGNPKKLEGIDCSGFVWYALWEAGYKVPNEGTNIYWYTGSMIEDALGPQQYLKRIDMKDAGPGDVVVGDGGGGESGNGGHTGILTEKWDGKPLAQSQTGVIHQGGVGPFGVQEVPFNQAGLAHWPRLVFARPIKK